MLKKYSQLLEECFIVLFVGAVVVALMSDSCYSAAPPAAVTSLSCSLSETTGHADLSWTVPGYPVAGGKFRIDFSVNHKTWKVNQYEIEIDTSFAAYSSHSCDIAGLYNNSTYYFVIWVKDEKPSNWSDASNEVYLITPCALPKNLSIAQESKTKLIISWGANNNSGLTEYELHYSTYSGGYTSLYSGTDLEYSHTGVTEGTAYYYRIRAKAVNGSFTDYVSAAYSPISVLSAVTVDDNHNGYIDAYKISFSAAVDDTSLIQSGSSGFKINGYSNAKFDPVGLMNHSDAQNDSVIYISFDEKNSPDTDKTPKLTYSEATGKLKSVAGSTLASLGDDDIIETDGAPPVLVSAQARDNNSGADGIQENDSVKLVFSEATNTPIINSDNIDVALVLSGGHSWKDGGGSIILAGWTAAGTLEIKLSASGTVPTVCPGDAIYIDASLLKDTAGNGTASSCVLGGSFGVNDDSPARVTLSVPNDKEVGVAVNIRPELTFSKEMNEQSVLSAVSLWQVKDNDAENVEAALAGANSYDSQRKVVTIVPSAALEKGCEYEIRVSGSAKDVSGTALKKAAVVRFSTVIDPRRRAIVTDDTGRTKIVVSENTFSGDFSFSIISDPLSEPASLTPGKILEAYEKTKTNDGAYSMLISSAIREINLYDAGKNSVKTEFVKQVMLTIGYPDLDKDGLVDGTCPPVREKTLRMYYLDEEHSLWVKVPGSSIDALENTVTVPCSHFSVYAILGTADHDLGQAYAFPVPFIPSKGDTKITFTNLSTLATIKIFTVSGELVRTIEHTSGSGQEEWDTLNDSGQKAASGAYLYVIKNERESKKGKLMIVR